jgi:pimeloyl-ACP methyl ester carboxylesterase
MSYDQYRRALITSFYSWQLDQFLNGFDSNCPTVILLPGGMGSELDRTMYPYPTSPNGMSETIWMDYEIIFGDALKLEIQQNARDIQSFVVAANGPLRFFLMTPYNRFIAFARRSRWNIFVFGYDWRRPLSESADLFKWFIYEFRRRVRAQRNPDPIPKVNIVCHSMGGLVCTAALRDLPFSRLKFHSIVTVATPFYGTSTQHDFYYIGMDLLNRFYPARTVSDIAATLPGPYSLLFLPKEVYDRDGASIGLREYPMRDYSSGRDTDPFDRSVLSRWPTRVRRHVRYLGQNRAELIELTKPLRPEVQPIFFNLRSAQDKRGCAVELLWDDVDGDTIDPGAGQSPIRRVLGPGDGTVPFWSAWHAYSRSANRYDLLQAKDHGFLLEHQEVMDMIDSVVTKRKLPKRVTRVSKRKPAVAGPRRVDKVLKELVRRRDRKRPPPSDLFNKSVQRAIIRKVMANG